MITKLKFKYMISKTTYYILIWFSIMMCVTASAQNYNKEISGVIVDVDNVPIVGRTINTKQDDIKNSLEVIDKALSGAFGCFFTVLYWPRHWFI